MPAHYISLKFQFKGNMKIGKLFSIHKKVKTKNLYLFNLRPIDRNPQRESSIEVGTIIKNKGLA